MNHQPSGAHTLHKGTDIGHSICAQQITEGRYVQRVPQARSPLRRELLVNNSWICQLTVLCLSNGRRQTLIEKHFGIGHAFVDYLPFRVEIHTD